MFQISCKRIGIALAGMLMSLSSLFGALPAGYTQLAFLESSGTQYIDTGVVFGNTNGFSVTYQVVYPINNQCVCGSRNDAGDTRCILGSNDNAYNIVFTNGTTVVTNTLYDSFAYLGWNDLKFNKSQQLRDKDKGTFDVNFLNSRKYNFRRITQGDLGTLTAQTGSFYLFATKVVSPSGQMLYSYCRIYEVRISAGANVIRHFVAARRDSDSELGMYDLVNDVFYTNQGTGMFIGGEPITQHGLNAYVRLPWLESTAGQYIDTGVTFTDSHGFAITYQTTTRAPNGNQIICGSRSSTGDTRCMVGSNDRDSKNYAYVGWNTLCTSHAIRDESEGTVTVNYLNTRTWDCRGQASGNLGTLAAQTGSFYLFSGNMAYSDGSRIGGRCRIMAFTMTRGNEVVMDLIPARRKVDDKPGMYDVVNDAFYVNQGSLEFIVGEQHFPDGYIGLDFIESTGTQYINTGVKCASNVTIEAMVYNARPASKHFMGARTAFQQNALGLSFQVESTDHEGYCVAWGYNLMGQSQTVGVGNSFHEFMFGGRYMRIDGHYYKNAIAAQNFTTDLDLFAFAVNQNGSLHSQTSSIRLSSLKMYRNGSLIRDYIPVMPTNSLAPGLYDMQNNVFYGNVGTGQFLAGDIVRGIDAPDAFAGEGFPASEIVGTALETKSFAVRDTGIYRLWFQYKGKGGTGHSLAAQMDGQSLGTVTTSTTNGWTAAHFDLRLGSGGHVLALQGAGAGKSTVVDAVTLRCLRKMPSGMTIVFK